MLISKPWSCWVQLLHTLIFKQSSCWVPLIHTCFVFLFFNSGFSVLLFMQNWNCGNFVIHSIRSVQYICHSCNQEWNNHACYNSNAQAVTPLSYKITTSMPFAHTLVLNSYCSLHFFSLFCLFATHLLPYQYYRVYCPALFVTVLHAFFHNILLLKQLIISLFKLLITWPICILVNH